MNLSELSNFIKYNQRFKENVGYQFLSFFSKLVVQIFFPVLMILTWGVEIFGIWLILLTIISTIYGVNLNATEVTRLEMTNAFNQKNNNALEKYYFNGFVAQIINIFLFSLLTLLIISFVDLSKYSNVNLDYLSIKNCFYFIIIAFYIEALTYIYYPTVNYEGYTKSWVNQNTFYQIYSKVLIILAFYFNEFYFLGLFLIVSNLLRFILIYNLHNKKKLKLNFKNFDKIILKDLFKKSLSYTLEKINYLLKQNGIILIVANFFSPTIVTLVSTARTLFYYLPINFFDVITHSSVIEFTKINLHNKVNEIKILFKKFFVILLIVSLIFFIGSNLIGKEIYEIWIKSNEIKITRSLIFLITLDAILIGYLNLLTAPFKGFNNFLFLTKIDFYLTLFSLITIVALIYIFNSLLLIFLLIVISNIILALFLNLRFKDYLKRL